MHHPQLPLTLFHFGKGRVFLVPDLLVGKGRGLRKQYKKDMSHLPNYNYCRLGYTFFKVVTVDLKPEDMCAGGGGAIYNHMNRRLCFQM